jgi:aldose 1-epimerase
MNFSGPGVSAELPAASPMRFAASQVKPSIKLFGLPPVGQLVTLKDGGTELVIAPECGARIVSFRVDERDVLRPASAAALASAMPYQFAAFPLMPYSGPIFGNGFQFGGDWYPLARNVPMEPTATHGEAWIMPWRCGMRSARSITLSVDYAPKEAAFPFAWRGDMTFTVGTGQLMVEMRLTNRDHRPMPAGLGLHPYFPKAPGTILTFDCTGVWPPDAPESVGRGCQPLEPGLDFRTGQDVEPIVLDRCFEGWNGVATLTAPDGFTTTISADPVFGKLQIYDAWDYPYICIEPVTNANDGFNRAALNVASHSVVVLEPGRSLTGAITISAGAGAGNM